MGDARKHNTKFYEHNPADLKLVLRHWGEGTKRVK